MGRFLRVAWGTLLGLVLAMPAVAQVQFGEFSNNLNGTISAGYTDNWGNMPDSSDHNWTVGGSGALSGFYYNPNFVSYTVSPYLNQSRANSDFQSISDASGVNLISNIFGGSHFPGSISYAKAYNSEGNFGIPGVSNFTTKGDSDTFGINWGENLPDAPSLSIAYQQGSNQYSIYGSNDRGDSSSRSFNVHSGYTVLGFSLGAYYSLGSGNASIPEIADLQQATQTHSDSSAYGFNLGHSLPLRGAFSAGINRSDVSTSALGDNYDATIDTMNTSLAFQPTDKLHLSVSADYSDNLSGQLLESLVQSGAVVPDLNTSEGSHSMNFMGVASYSFLPNLQTSAFAEHRVQHFLGENFGANSYGGSVSYGHTLLGGTFNGAVTLSDNTSDTNSTSSLGFSGTANYSRRILGWAVSGSFTYSQNVQTLLITYMASVYNYSGNVRRRFGNFTFSAGAGAGRTGLTAEPGTQNTNESYNLGLGYGRWVTATGSYSKSSENGLLTAGGLVPVPVPSPVLPISDLILYGGRSYSVGLSSTPGKKLTLSASFAKSNSNTFSDSLASANHNEGFNALIQYNFRKMYFTSGYSRLNQGFSLSGTPPQMVSSFYVGVSRWFNFF